MNIFLNVIVQILGVIVLYGNQALTIVPEKYKGLVTGITGTAMGITAILAHFRNPDGTKAEKPYDPTAIQ